MRTRIKRSKVYNSAITAGFAACMAVVFITGLHAAKYDRFFANYISNYQAELNIGSQHEVQKVNTACTMIKCVLKGN